MLNYLASIVEIIIACFVVELGFRLWDTTKKRKLDIGCDYCEEVKKIYRTPDKKFYLCKMCMEAYLTENEFPDEEKAKVRKRYKISRKKK